MIYLVNKLTKEHIIHRSTNSASGVDHTCWKAHVADDDGWIDWNGGECPLPDGHPVEVKHRNGLTYTEKCGEYHSHSWSHMDHKGDIIAYRPILDDQEQPATPKWQGTKDGPPPAGTLVTWGDTNQLKVIASSNPWVWVRNADAPATRGFVIKMHFLRPILTDQEQWAKQAKEVMGVSGESLNGSIDAIYDALLSGELPMPKEES
ncbi:hypothetical protein [Vreelandella massiliensis]|uniref:hypothetical protein n=1 Tax=Vreelandella massiliensis TaxID=1816686 RepID=UPI00096A5A9B|nr:hypothetical protein [Halomonas massiliensis]